MHRLFLCLVLAVFSVLAATKTNAQAVQPASLVADEVTYNARTGVLRAVGNVQVFYQGSILTTNAVIYDQNTDSISVPGSFVIRNEQNVVISGDSTTLDARLQAGMLQGARVLVNQQLQIAAAQLQTSGSRYNVLDKVVASTCYVCRDNPTPFWQIRSARVIHDQELRRLYFEKATLDFLGVPVLYVPRFRIPEPGVERASGFLVPSFKTSNKLGTTIRVPYYFALNDHSDLTVTPYLGTKESFIIEAEYRRRTKNGAYRLNGALALADPLNDTNFGSFIEGEGSFALKDGYRLDFGLDVVSQNDFKTDYNYDDQDRHNSFLSLSKTTSNSLFEGRIAFTQSFRLGESPSDIPVTLPELYFRKTNENSFLGGRSSFIAQSVTLLRENENPYTRIGGQAKWQNYWYRSNGIIYGAQAELTANAYLTDGKTTSSLMPTGAIEARYPMARQIGSVTHVLEPVVQLVFSPNKALGSGNIDPTTNDSTTAEFEETNLFSTNRFPGFDETEAGLRANVGIQYLRYDPSGWTLGATVGRVFRDKNLNQFGTNTSTGLDNINSDFVGAVSLSLPGKFQFLNRSLFDSDFNISKNETQLAFKHKKLSVNATYVWLDQFSVLNVNDRQHEINVGASYSPNVFWTFKTDWRQNLNNGNPIEGNFGAVYENECARINLSYSLQYDEDGNVDKEFGLKVSLTGLGQKAKKANFARRCGR